MFVKIWRKIVQILFKEDFCGMVLREIDVCKPKIKGDIVVRDFSLVNLALLVKWRWRFISGASSFWRDIIASCHI